MALKRDDSMAAIERALRVALSRQAERGVTSSNFDAPARWASYRRDDVPWNQYDPYNDPWRKTPVRPGLGGSDGDDEPRRDDDAGAGAGGDDNYRPPSGDFSGNDWMVPGLQQYAAINAALAQRGLIESIAPTLTRIGQPSTWTSPEKTAALSTRRDADEPAAPAAPRTSVSTPATRDEALDDIADLERTAQEVEDMNNVSTVTPGLALGVEPGMTAAQVAALSTLGREPSTVEPEGPEAPAQETDEDPGVATTGLNPGLPSEFTAPNSAIAAALANEQMAAIEESQAQALAAMETQATQEGRTAGFASPSLAQSLDAVREVSIPSFLAEELSRAFTPSMPSWAINPEVDKMMTPTPAPEEFSVPAPAIEQALAASIASMTGRTPESVVANLPNVEESLAAAVEDEQAGVQAANMSMADIEESQAQALTAMQEIAHQMAIENAIEQGVQSMTQTATPGVVGMVAEPQGMPSYYAPMSLPSVAEEVEGNVPEPGRVAFGPPAPSLASLAQAEREGVSARAAAALAAYEESRALAEEQASQLANEQQSQPRGLDPETAAMVEQTQQALQTINNMMAVIEMENLAQTLPALEQEAPGPQQPGPAPSQTNAPAPGMIQGMINGLLGISPAYAGMQFSPQAAMQPGLMQQQIENPAYALDDFLGPKEESWSDRVIGPMINNELRSMTIDPYAFTEDLEPTTPEIDPQDIEPANVQNMSFALTNPMAFTPQAQMYSMPAPEEEKSEEPAEEPASLEAPAPVSVENFSVVSIEDLDPATRAAVENAAMATARSMSNPTEVTVAEPAAYSIPGMTVSAPSSLTASLAGLDYAQPAVMSVAMSQAQNEENDPASSFTEGLSDPASHAASSLGFGMDGMFSAGLGVGFGPEGMTGQAPGQDPSAASSSFGGAGLGQSAAETSASQMSSLGLEGMFSSAFSNPSAFSGYGPSAAPSEEGVEGQEGVNGLEGGLGMDGIGADPAGAATGGEDGQGEGDTGDAGGATGDGSGSAGDGGGGSGGSGGSGGGMGGDPGGAGTDSSNDGSGGISRDGGRITKPKWTVKERDRATAAIERALRVVKTRQTERDAKLKSKRKAKVA